VLPVQEEEVFSSHEKHETTIFGWAEYTIHDSVSSIWIRNDRASRRAREEYEGGYPAGQRLEMDYLAITSLTSSLPSRKSLQFCSVVVAIFCRASRVKKA